MKYRRKKLYIGSSFSDSFLESPLILTIPKCSTTKNLKRLRSNSTKICLCYYDATLIKSNCRVL